MSNMYDEQEYESNAMRVLREKADADSVLIREMSERLAKAEERQARTDLEAAVKAAGLDPKVASMVPKGENPQEWLKTNGELFAKKVEAAIQEGVEPSGAPVPDAVPAAEAQALAAIAQAADGAVSPVALDAVQARIASATTEAEVTAILKEQLGGIAVQFD